VSVLTTGIHLLDQFHLDCTRLAHQGIPQMKVTLDTDASCILNASAQDKSTGKTSHAIVVTDGQTV
jgi:molecular chaperone DnaK (HSP70)